MSTVTKDKEETIRVHRDKLAEIIGCTSSWIGKAADGDYLVYPPEHRREPRDTTMGYPVRQWMEKTDRYGRIKWFNVPVPIYDELMELKQKRGQ